MANWITVEDSLKGRARAVEREQERIIKLLETLRCESNGVEHDCTDDLGGYGVDDIIALIKGETHG